MRIIAGTAKGVRLERPSGNDVRPTLDRVRESLFSIIAPNLEGCTFIDLFAGTGANGIEALSRGAARAKFVDNDPRSIALIEKNLERTQLSSKGTVIRGALPACLTRLEKRDTVRGQIVVYADPPHAFTKFPELLGAIAKLGLLQQDGLLILEHRADAQLGEIPAAISQTREASYGKTQLTFFEPAPGGSSPKTS